MGRVVHFEIQAADTVRAVTFYQEIFGWTITRWDGPMEYWLIKTGDGPGIDGAILPRRGAAPGPEAPTNGYVCTTSVASIDETIAAIEKAGGEIVVPKMDIPGVGTLAYAHDTEANVFGVLQPISDG
jgi:predicted enzyme related to lactoylglutathione lyase